MKTYIGIDVGGSSIKAALVDETGKISQHQKVKTPESLEDFYQAIETLVKTYQATARPEGIALSMPGAVDCDAGVIGGASAVPYIHGPHIKQDLEARCHLRVEMENDANCAALAEVWIGNASDVNDSMFVVIGSGIGGALIKDKKVHHGIHLHGGEYGYTVQDFDEETLSFKTWSDTGSTIALVNRVAQEKGLDPQTIDGTWVFEHAKDDAVCQKHIDKFYYALAVGIYNLQYIFDPEVIIIGGGVSAQPDMVAQINQRMDIILEKIAIAHVRPVIRTCKYHNDANIIGAVYHWMTK